MSKIVSLASHLAPDSISRLELAAIGRFVDAEKLVAQKRFLAAIYLFGYSVEMCVTAAFFRSAGFHPNASIDRDTRQRRMAQARQLQTPAGSPMMNSDPHPLGGWARFLLWRRMASGALTQREMQRLRDAVAKAEIVYRHWRPELRYKNTNVQMTQLAEVRKATIWFKEHVGKL